MSRERYQRLVEHVFERADDSLRGVVRYHDGEFDLLCKRDDVDVDAFQRRTELTIKQATHKYRQGGDDAPGVDPDTHVELFDGIAVVHLREDPDAGVVYSFEMAAAADLAEFVEECHRILERDEASPQAATADD